MIRRQLILNTFNDMAHNCVSLRYYVASPENRKLPRRDVMFGNQTQSLDPYTPEKESFDKYAAVHFPYGRYDTVAICESTQSRSELFSSSPRIPTPRAATPRIPVPLLSSSPLSWTQATTLPSSPTPKGLLRPAKRWRSLEYSDSSSSDDADLIHGFGQRKAARLSTPSSDASSVGHEHRSCSTPSSPSPLPSCLDDHKKPPKTSSLVSGQGVPNERTQGLFGTKRLLRTLPPHIEINLEFPRFYTQFTRPSSDTNPSGRDGRVYNVPRSSMDLYTPRWTKGVGDSKVGLCPICIPETWFKMKVSAFWYHMNFYHGISPKGQPYSPPLEFRRTEHKPKKSTCGRVMVASGAVNPVIRTVFVEGKCHKCNKWIKLEGPREGSVNVAEIYWWKHASSCHKGSRIPGDDNWLVTDDDN